MFICASALITCAIITSRTLLPCDLTILLSTSARLLCVATILCVVYHSYEIEMDTEKQRQHRRDDMRLTESGNTRSKQLHIRGAYRVANQQRMAAKRALEWIRTSKSQLVFRYEISDLLFLCCWKFCTSYKLMQNLVQCDWAMLLSAGLYQGL